MAAVRKYLLIFSIFIFIVFSGYLFVNYYPYIFSRKVKGVIVKVERVDMNMTMLQTGRASEINPKVFSFAVAIKEDSGEIVTASAEDRQWAVAQSGQCAEAVYYPYPPWQLDKANTYFGARLEKLSECAK
ncbi:MAG: hypothetical protein ACAH59_06415 [Pseudobdellovibrionaceae bacterium]